MKLTLESTTQITQLAGKTGSMEARIWEGHTGSGIPVVAFITLLRVADPDNPEELPPFERELEERRAPSAEVQAIPLRMIL